MKTQKSSKVRLTISMDEGVYEKVKEISARMGMKASIWITMISLRKRMTSMW